MNKSLIELTQIANDIQMKLMESMGEVTDEIEKALVEIESRLPDKVDGYKFIIDKAQSDIEFWTKKSDEAHEIAQRLSNYISKLKEVTVIAAAQMQVNEIVGHEYIAKIINSPHRVIIENDQEIPQDFKEIVQTTCIKKKEILETIKSGKDVPGAHLEQSKYVKFVPRKLK